MTIKRLALLGYGLALSAVIGIIAAAFLILEGLMTDLVWSSHNQIFETFLVIVGSIILYYLVRRFPNLPIVAHDSLAELKTSQTIDYQNVFWNLLITLIVLSFGAGVGPEGALLSAIISLSIWESDNLRYLYFHYDELKKIPIHARFKRLLNPFKYRQKYDEELAPKTSEAKRWKRVLYLIFTVNGIFAFAVLLRQTDQPSFVMKLGQSHWQLNEIWLVPLLMIVGFAIGYFCLVIKKILDRLINKMNLSLAYRIGLGAIGIILISYLAPELLFSGQHSLHLLVGTWTEKSIGFLILMALLKLLFLAWCLRLNWRGGDIFPITFAAMIFGFAIATVLPQYDRLLIVAVVATSVMSELISPIVAGIFLLFFFPVSLMPIILVVAILFFLKNKFLPKTDIKSATQE